MAKFLNTAPDVTVTQVVATVGAFDDGAEFRYVGPFVACATACRFFQPAGEIPYRNNIGWLQGGFVQQPGGRVMYPLGSGQPVIIGPRYLVVASNDPNNVDRGNGANTAVNPIHVWSFWRGRFVGALSVEFMFWY